MSCAVEMTKILRCAQYNKIGSISAKVKILKILTN